ncbi:MAG TPA: peptidase M20, partial [Phenylobacterium sp.]
MKKLLLSAAAVALVSGAACAAPAAIDATRILQDIKVLSSDDFEGRGPATEGEKKTIAYLIQQMKAAGLQPAGDLMKDGKRAWTQDVPLVRSVAKGPVTVSVHMGGQDVSWKQGEEIAVRATLIGDRLSVKDAPVVFAGYGVKAPERNWDDFKGMNLKGKVVLVLVNDPDFETGKGDFGGKAMTYYGRWTYKYEEAARQGAAGILIVHETEPAGYPWEVVRGSWTGPLEELTPDGRYEQAIQGWVSHDAAEKLFSAAGLKFDELASQADQPGFKPVPLRLNANI